MAKNKSQHFVPQHYLRQFRIEDTKSISVVRLEPFGFYHRAAIKAQCKADYFYRTDGDLDEIYKVCENDLAPVLAQVAEKRSFDSQELTALQLFSVLMHVRTRKAVEHAKVFPRKHFSEFIKCGIANGELTPPPEGWRDDMVDFGNAAGHLFKTQAMSGWLEMRTLECKLLEPEQGAYFVTSDHPAILLNQIFEHERPYRSFVGFSRSGFQMILPISPFVCLFFYDPKVYKVGGRRERLVRVSKQDTDLINSLQVQSSEECLFLHDPNEEKVMESLARRYANIRAAVYEPMREYPGRNDREKLWRLSQFSPFLPRSWSFCRLKRRPNIGEDRRRDIVWTAYIKEVVGDMDANPGRGLFESMESVLGCTL